MSVILGCICLVAWLLFEKVTAQVLTLKAVVNSTGITSLTSMQNRCSRGISYQETKMFPQGVYLLATQGSTTGPILSNQYIFASNGSKLVQFTNLPGALSVVEAVGMSSESISFICTRSEGQFNIKVSLLNGIYSMERDSQQKTLTMVMAIWVDPNSEYKHYVREVPTCVYSRWGARDTTGQHCLDNVCNNPPSFYPVQGQLLVYGACNAPLVYIEQTTGIPLKSLTTLGAVYSHISDTFIPTKIYSASLQDFPPVYLSAIDTSMPTGSIIELYPRITLAAGDSINTKLMLFKEFRYLAFLVNTTSGGFLRLVETQTFSISSASRFTEAPLPFLSIQNNVQGLQLLKRRRLHFGLQASDPGNNFQSFYLEIDLCQKVGTDRCATCPSGYYVSPATKSPNNPAECFPVGYGKNWINSTTSFPELEACKDPYCVECANNISTCTKCDSKNSTAMFIFRGVCIFREQIPDAWGTSAGKQPLESCADTNCQNCSLDFNTCTKCQESNGFVLLEKVCTKCEQVRPYFAYRTEVPGGADFSIDMASQPALESKTLLFHNLKREGKLNVTFWSYSAPETQITTDMSVKIDSGSFGFSVSLLFRSNPPTGRFRVRVSTENFTFAFTNTSGLSCTSMQPLLGVFDLDPPQFSRESMLAAQERGKQVAGPVAILTADHPVGASVQTLGNLLDTSGGLGLVGRSAPLISRLAFINIKFGSLLQAYLENSRYAVQDTIHNTVLHSDGTKGKITLYRLPLSVGEALFWKVLVYVVTWANRLLLKRFWRPGDVERNVSALVKYYYFSQKLHFIAFSVCLPDATFILPRTIFDSKGLSLTYYALAILVWSLLSYDLVLIYIHLTTPWKLMKVLHENIGEFRVIPTKKPTQSEEDELDQPQTKQINYKKTYFNIDHDIHLLASVTGVYNLDQRVADSRLCRSLMLCSWMRLVILQELGILACQYCVKLGLSFMLLFETLRITLSVVAYWHYKYYRSSIVLLIDIIQSISFISFLGVCLWISDAVSNSAVSIELQQITIWILTVGIVSEYLLTAIYVILCFWRLKVNKTAISKFKLQKVNEGWLKLRLKTTINTKRVNFNEAASSANALLEHESPEKQQKINPVSKSRLGPLTKTLCASKSIARNRRLIVQKVPT